MSTYSWYIQLRASSEHLDGVNTLPEIFDAALEMSNNIAKDRVQWVLSRQQQSSAAHGWMRPHLACDQPSTSGTVTKTRRRINPKK
jgi:hypothetical protein